MKNQQQFLDLRLTLPENITTHLEAVMEDEFTIACRKWSLTLTEEQKATIMEHSKRQLEGKVYNSCHHRWIFGAPLLVVGVRKTSEADDEDVALPQEAEPDLLIVRSNNEWKLDEDPSDEAVPLSSFYSHFLALLEQWLRTAVFYGVGSYGQ